MKIKFFIILLLLSATNAYSQKQDIVGSWISSDSLNQVHFFIKSNGTVQKRSATGKEDVWSKAPRIGSYEFQDGKNIIIIWNDKSIEKISVKFIKGGAEFTSPGKSKPQSFVRIVDEEVIEGK